MDNLKREKDQGFDMEYLGDVLDKKKRNRRQISNTWVWVSSSVVLKCC